MIEYFLHESLLVDFLIALILDAIFGDPPGLPHPVRWMGSLIAFEEKASRKLSSLTTRSREMLWICGGCIVLCNIAIAFLIPFGLLQLLQGVPWLFHLVNIWLLYTSFAAGCLKTEALRIRKALEAGLEEARHQLSFIVGRETKGLSKQEVIRATVETVGENTSDGMIAPMLFAMVGGAPLALAYKMVNTMDSMLGYQNDKYRDLGFFPAKADDWFNLIPARITGLLMCLSSAFRFPVREGLRIMIRDRNNHKSPNCAWPEGAVAGLLGVQLGGANVYFGELVKKPTIGDKKRELEPNDINRTVEILFRTELLLAVIWLALERLVL